MEKKVVVIWSNEGEGSRMNDTERSAVSCLYRQMMDENHPKRYKVTGRGINTYANMYMVDQIRICEDEEGLLITSSPEMIGMLTIIRDVMKSHCDDCRQFDDCFPDVKKSDISKKIDVQEKHDRLIDLYMSGNKTLKYELIDRYDLVGKIDIEDLTDMVTLLTNTDSNLGEYIWANKLNRDTDDPITIKECYSVAREYEYSSRQLSCIINIIRDDLENLSLEEIDIKWKELTKDIISGVCHDEYKEHLKLIEKYDVEMCKIVDIHDHNVIYSVPVYDKKYYNLDNADHPEFIAEIGSDSDDNVVSTPIGKDQLLKDILLNSIDGLGATWVYLEKYNVLYTVKYDPVNIVAHELCARYAVKKLLTM